MGRTYWFECARCGYRARVSGGADRGFNLFVQTVLCRDCRQLYDAVTRLKVPAEFVTALRGKPTGAPPTKPTGKRLPAPSPPRFQDAVDRLLYPGAAEFAWLRFKPQCPISVLHRIEPWSDPGKCPRCGLPLDKNALPFKIWD